MFWKIMDSGSWSRLMCPCGAINWVYFSQDECAMDIERVKCHKCKKTYALEDDFFPQDNEEGDDSEAEEGLESPVR